MILNDSLLQNGTVVLANGSLNLTVNVIAENLTGKLVSDDSAWSVAFPIITLIIGAALTYIFNIFEIRRQEKKEICRYEYTLITDILDIMRDEQAQDKMVNHYNEEKREPAFIKIKNYRLITDFMKDVIDRKTPDTKDLKKIKEDLVKEI